MFKGKLSILKNLAYVIILGFHTYLIAYFLYYVFLNYILTAIIAFSFSCLIIFAFYTFLTSKSYYYYFYIGIIVSCIPMIFVIYLSALFIVPEFIIILILLSKGLEQGSNYYKMLVNKKANVMHHDPGVTHLRSPGYLPTAFRMDEVWNPDSSVPLKGEDKNLEKKVFNVKIQVFIFILTVVCFTFSLISAMHLINPHYSI